MARPICSRSQVIDWLEDTADRPSSVQYFGDYSKWSTDAPFWDTLRKHPLRNALVRRNNTGHPVYGMPSPLADVIWSASTSKWCGKWKSWMTLAESQDGKNLRDPHVFRWYCALYTLYNTVTALPMGR